jgi:riboflavin synthase
VFTGLIETKGKVLSNQNGEGSNRLTLSSSLEQLQWGESIAVNGVCLTLLASEKGTLNFDLSPETLRVTSLAQLEAGDWVNLERAMLASTRFGGHYVSGHVDALAQVQAMHSMGEYIELQLGGFDAAAMLYLIPKGSITVEGVSLTINAVVDQSIQLMLIPHTLQQTTLGQTEVGQLVNIEFDYLTRIVAHQLQITEKLNCGAAL